MQNPKNTNFSDAYGPVYDLAKRIQEAEDLRRTELAQRRGEIKKTLSRESEVYLSDDELENAWGDALNPDRQETEADKDGKLKFNQEKEKSLGERFALKMNTEFSNDPRQFIETVKEAIRDVTGISVMEVDDETTKIVTRIAKELGEKVELYSKPENFSSLKEFLGKSEVGLGISSSVKGPLEAELNMASKAVIAILNKRVFKEEKE